MPRLRSPSHNLTVQASRSSDFQNFLKVTLTISPGLYEFLDQLLDSEIIEPPPGGGGGSLKAVRHVGSFSPTEGGGLAEETVAMRRYLGLPAIGSSGDSDDYYDDYDGKQRRVFFIFWRHLER